MRLLLCAALLPALMAPALAVADDPALPEVRVRRTPRLLHLEVRPGTGTHLATELPLQAMVHDGSITVAERNGAVPDTGDRADLTFPILPGGATNGWQITIRGGICSDEGERCVPFHASGLLPRTGPPRAVLTTVPGRGPDDVFERPPPSRQETPQGPRTQPPAADELHWYSASREGDVDRAFAASRKRRVPLLADFFAVWCPPCDVLRNEFLEDPARRALLSRFVLLKLDADASSSFTVKDRYAVGGYPTVLLVAPDGSVLDRIEGYPGADHLGVRLSTVLDGPSLAVLQANYGRTVGEDRARTGLAVTRRLQGAGEFDEAWAMLLDAAGSDFSGWPDDAVLCGAELAEALDRPEKTELFMRRAAVPGPIGERAARVIAAADVLPADERAAWLREHRDPLIAELLAQTEADVAWSADGGGADVKRLVVGGPEVQWSFVDAAYYLGTSEDVVDTERGLDLLAFGAASATLGILQSDGRAPVVPTDRPLTLGLRPTIGTLTAEQVDLLTRFEGRYHDLVGLLIRAGLHDTAEDYLQRLVSAFPDVFTWHYRYAGFLRDHRTVAEALPVIDRALAHAYGDNALRAAGRKAEILHALARTEEARAALDTALNAPVPTQPGVRTHRYRQALLELRRVLSGR